MAAKPLSTGRLNLRASQLRVRRPHESKHGARHVWRAQHERRGRPAAGHVPLVLQVGRDDGVSLRLVNIGATRKQRSGPPDRLYQTVIFLGFVAVNRAARDRILARIRSIRRVAEPGVITDHAPSRPGRAQFVDELIQMPTSSHPRGGRSGARSSSTTGGTRRQRLAGPRGAIGHTSGREIGRDSEPARLTFAIGYHLFPDRHRTSQI